MNHKSIIRRQRKLINKLCEIVECQHRIIIKFSNNQVKRIKAKIKDC
jgi:DNA-directed RNA polymerase subunit RPC12/RpoP